MSVRRLFIDLETSPMIAYTWAIGRKVSLGHDNILKEPKIICAAYKWEGKEVQALTWDRNQCDKAMMASLVRIMMQADEIIAHNGDRFDVPWIRTRCVIHGIRIPHQLPTVDTLKQARRGFRFPSNRLDYLGQYLGHGKKKDTGGFGLWKSVMDKDAQALRDMVSYCKRDVDLLEKVWGSLYAYVKPTTHVGVAAGGYKHWCPSCGSSNVKRNGNKYVTNNGVIRCSIRCKDCNHAFRMNETQARNEQLRQHKDEQLAKGLR